MWFVRDAWRSLSLFVYKLFRPFKQDNLGTLRLSSGPMDFRVQRGRLSAASNRMRYFTNWIDIGRVIDELIDPLLSVHSCPSMIPMNSRVAPEGTTNF